MMKKVLAFFLLAGFLILSMQPVSSQEEKKDLKKETSIETPKKSSPSYSPAGRRDPFRDLLIGREVEESGIAEEVPQISIDDITLIGIVRIKDEFQAIINSPQGFPFTIRVNDKFADGFVLSIKESQVVFRKTKERGISLIKPKDVVKEIYLEER